MKHFIGKINQDQKEYNITIEIDIKDTHKNKNVLSISGSIERNMRDWLTGGQCQDSIKLFMVDDAIIYNEGWNKEKLAKLLKVWDNWHLNDMHPECEHQAKDGTLEDAKQKATIYGYRLTDEARKSKKDIEERIKKFLIDNLSVRITKREQELLKLEDFIKTTSSTPEKYYISCGGDSYFGNETKTRGWISYDEHHTIGVLGKPCKTCGYKYGSAWNMVELPAEVVDFINNL